MYQQERKQRFIDRYTVRETRDTITAMFNTIAPYEEQFGRDVSEMSDEELQETIDKAMAVRAVSRYSKLRYLQKYIQWCAASGYENVTDAYKRVRSDGIDKMRRQFVVNPTQLQLTLDRVYDPVDDDTIDVICRCYLWLGFMCFPEKRIAELTAEHLKFDAHKLVFDGISYQIYQESAPVFHKAAELTEFTYRHTTPDYEIKRTRFLGSGLLRGIKGDFEPLTMRTKVARRVKDAVKKSKQQIQEVSYKRLDISGMFYAIYIRECAGEPVFPRQEFYERFAARGIRQSSAFNMANIYVQDYERWKVAFMK